MTNPKVTVKGTLNLSMGSVGDTVEIIVEGDETHTLKDVMAVLQSVTTKTVETPVVPKPDEIPKAVEKIPDVVAKAPETKPVIAGSELTEKCIKCQKPISKNQVNVSKLFMSVPMCEPCMKDVKPAVK